MKRGEGLKTGEAEWKAERMPGEGFEVEHQMMGMTADKYPEGVGFPENGGGHSRAGESAKCSSDKTFLPRAGKCA